MPKTSKDNLSDLSIKTAKAGNKTIKLRDGAGLFLVVDISGKKWWKYRAIFAGKETSFSFGEYPSVTLAQARRMRDENNSLIANGIDPKTNRQKKKSGGDGSFKAVAVEWLDKFLAGKSESHIKATRTRMETDIFPYIGTRPIKEITSPEMLVALRRIEKRGAIETAARLKAVCGKVFRYAIAGGLADNDPTLALKESLTPKAKVKHMAAPTDPKEIAPLLRMLDGYTGSLPVACALRLSPLVFVRPGELRQAEWDGIDWDKSEWRYFVTKTKVEHIVPLSRQAIEILQELYQLTGLGKYLFPSSRSATRPMSNNTVNAAMRRMGIDTQEELTGHGFRAMARTVLDEVLGVRPDIIEHQLAHAVRDPLGRAYNRTSHLPERKEMMQTWSDYLDKLKAGAVIIPIRAAV